MAKWIDLIDVSDMPADGKLCTQADKVPIVVMRVEGDWFAVRNSCPHAGLPLGEGDLRGHVLTCPFHGYAYNIKNGRNIDWPEDEMPVKTYPVRVEGGVVQVEMPEPKPTSVEQD